MLSCTPGNETYVCGVRFELARSATETQLQMHGLFASNMVCHFHNVVGCGRGSKEAAYFKKSCSFLHSYSKVRLDRSDVQLGLYRC